jgi:hypothetical protein
LQRAVALGNVETSDTDWITVRQHLLAYIDHLGGAYPASESTELHRLGDTSVDSLRNVVQRRRVWFGRWGRPSPGPASAT